MSILAHIYYPEAEAGRLKVGSQPGFHNEIILKQNKKDMKETKRKD